MGPKEQNASEDFYPFPWLSKSKAIEYCHYCEKPQVLDYTFCSDCGNRRKDVQQKLSEERLTFQSNLKDLGLFGILFALVIAVYSYLPEGFYYELILSLSFAIITLVFTFKTKGIGSLVLPPKLNRKALWGILAVTLISPWLVSFFIEKLNNSLGLDSTHLLIADAPYPLLTTLVLTALFPALFEELSFRGFLFQYLQKMGGEKAAIWLSSFLFAIAHFSLLSLFWLFPFGLILAHFRLKYQTLFYGIIGHFLHNFTVILIEYYGLFE